MQEFHIPRFTTMDPLCEKYYSTSPYAYCNNNPVKYIDPDGREIEIHYQENGKGKVFIFTGENADRAPKNTFVQNVITAYNYNKKNGGGENLQKAAKDTKQRYAVAQTEDASSGDVPNRMYVVRWNPYAGLETTDGGTQSPATVLEHEMAHAYQYENHTEQYRADKRQIIVSYRNQEERRVITGPERKTAKANNEGIRNNHRGRSIVTETPISNQKIKYLYP